MGLGRCSITTTTTLFNSWLRLRDDVLNRKCLPLANHNNSGTATTTTGRTLITALCWLVGWYLRSELNMEMLGQVAFIKPNSTLEFLFLPWFFNRCSQAGYELTLLPPMHALRCLSKLGTNHLTFWKTKDSNFDKTSKRPSKRKRCMLLTFCSNFLWILSNMLVSHTMTRRNSSSVTLLPKRSIVSIVTLPNGYHRLSYLCQSRSGIGLWSHRFVTRFFGSLLMLAEPSGRVVFSPPSVVGSNRSPSKRRIRNGFLGWQQTPS